MSRLSSAMRRRRRIRIITIMCVMTMSMLKLITLWYDLITLYKTLRRRSLRDAMEKSMTRMIGFEDEENSETLTSRSGDSAQSKKRKKLTPLRCKDTKKMRAFTSVALDPEIEGLREISTAIQGMSSHFATIASALADYNKREQLRENKTNIVVEELSPLGLPCAEMFRAATILLNEPSVLNLFSQLSLEQKRQYVYTLLYPSSSLRGSASNP